MLGRLLRPFFYGSVAAAVLAATMLGLPSSASADDTTVSYDTLRTGWDANEPALGPAAVSASDFGQLFSTPVSGQVYAQPLVVAGTVVTATENNYIYGLDAVSRCQRNAVSVHT